MMLADDYMYENLAGRAAGLEEALFELQIAIKHLLQNILIESAAVSEETGLTGVKLPKISDSHIRWQSLILEEFWEQFNTTIHSKTS